MQNNPGKCCFWTRQSRPRLYLLLQPCEWPFPRRTSQWCTS